MTAAAPGDRVSVHYTARLADGSVLESTLRREPLEFVAGAGDVLSGLSRAVIGMSPGERKVVSLEPEDAFGPRDAELERRVARRDLPEGIRVGDQFRAEAGGRAIPVWVREMDEEYAVLDANPPLAGLHLIFEIEVVAVRGGA